MAEPSGKKYFPFGFDKSHTEEMIIHLGFIKNKRIIRLGFVKNKVIFPLGFIKIEEYFLHISKKIPTFAAS